MAFNYFNPNIAIPPPPHPNMGGLQGYQPPNPHVYMPPALLPVQGGDASNPSPVDVAIHAADHATLYRLQNGAYMRLFDQVNMLSAQNNALGAAYAQLQQQAPPFPAHMQSAYTPHNPGPVPLIRDLEDAELEEFYEDIPGIIWDATEWSNLVETLNQTKSSVAGAPNQKLAFLVNAEGTPLDTPGLKKVYHTFHSCLKKLKELGRIKPSWDKLDTESQQYCIRSLHNAHFCMRLCSDMWKAEETCAVKFSDWGRTHAKEKSDDSGTSADDEPSSSKRKLDGDSGGPSKRVKTVPKVLSKSAATKAANLAAKSKVKMSSSPVPQSQPLAWSAFESGKNMITLPSDFKPGESSSSQTPPPSSSSSGFSPSSSSPPLPADKADKSETAASAEGSLEDESADTLQEGLEGDAAEEENSAGGGMNWKGAGDEGVGEELEQANEWAALYAGDEPKQADAANKPKQAIDGKGAEQDNAHKEASPIEGGDADPNGGAQKPKVTLKIAPCKNKLSGSAAMAPGPSPETMVPYNPVAAPPAPTKTESLAKPNGTNSNRNLYLTQYILNHPNTTATQFRLHWDKEVSSATKKIWKEILECKKKGLEVPDVILKAAGLKSTVEDGSVESKEAGAGASGA